MRNHIEPADWSEAGNALDMAQLMFGGLTSVGVFFVLFFYLLGALYDDRRDRSVLFWKSLPVSDTATVASKALAAMVIAPVIAFVVASAAYILSSSSSRSGPARTGSTRCRRYSPRIRLACCFGSR